MGKRSSNDQRSDVFNDNSDDYKDAHDNHTL
jgi:hypothetical protein